MATYNPRLVGSSDPLGSLMTESTGGGSSDKDGKGMGKADESHNGSNYFKSAQWYHALLVSELVAVDGSAGHQMAPQFLPQVPTML